MRNVTDFARVVGRPVGLERGIEGSKATHTKLKTYYGALERDAPEHKNLTPADLKPQVLKKGIFTSVVEDSEQVAKRISQTMQQHYEPAIQSATVAHLSPAQAAQIADVSRWTIMRAIKSSDLQAFRDNKNLWRIKADDLNAWLSAHPAQCAHTVQEEADAHPVHTHAHPDPIPKETLELARLKAELEAEKTLRATVESDRDHWRELAQKLAESRPRKWWFW